MIINNSSLTMLDVTPTGYVALLPAWCVCRHYHVSATMRLARFGSGQVAVSGHLPVDKLDRFQCSYKVVGKPELVQ